MKLSRRKKIFLYNDENEKIASLEYSIRKKEEIKEAHIFNFVVFENFRRMGVGKEFFKQTKEMIVEEYGANRITIDYLKKDKNAENFWKSIGFVYSHETKYSIFSYFII